MATEEKAVLGNVEFKVEVDGDIAKLTPVDEHVFTEAAKAQGITKEEIKKIDNFRNQYLKDTVKIINEESKKILKENKNIEVINAKMPFGINKTDLAEVKVQRTFKARRPGTNEVTFKPRISLGVEMKATKVSSQYVKSLRDELDEFLANG